MPDPSQSLGQYEREEDTASLVEDGRGVEHSSVEGPALLAYGEINSVHGNGEEMTDQHVRFRVQSESKKNIYCIPNCLDAA